MVGAGVYYSLRGTREMMYRDFPEGQEHPDLPAFSDFYIAQGDGKGDLYMWSPDTLTWEKQ